MRPFSHFQPILQLDIRWPLTLVYDLWPNEHMKVPIRYQKTSLVPIELQLFKWGHFHTFSLSYNLTSDDRWPWYMTFDQMNIWRFPYYINKPSLVPIELQPFQMRPFSHIQPYLTTWLQMTFDLGMWPLTSLTYVMWSSKMSRNSQIPFLRYSQIEPIVSFVSYCLFNPSIVSTFGTNCPISVRFSPNKSVNNTLKENANKKKSYFSTSDSFCLIASHINISISYQ